MTRREEWSYRKQIRKLKLEVQEVRSWNHNQGETIIRLLDEKATLLAELSR